MRKVKNFIGYWLLLAVIIGLTPYYAYKQAFPWGIRDYYEAVKFDYNHTNLLDLYHGQDSIQRMSVSKSFLINEIPQYAIHVTRLQAALPGQTFVISIDENRGGAELLLTALVNSIKQTKAEVIMTIKHFGLSCGTFVLNAGNYIILPNSSLLLFHTGSYNGIRVVPNSTDPIIAEGYKVSVEMMQPYRSYVSSKDYARYLTGEDVYLMGSDICNSYGDSAPPILFHYAGGCVLKGLKS